MIAPASAQVYTGDAFPAWRNSLFVGSLKDKTLVRPTLLTDRGHRVRDVRPGPDGALYVVT